MEFSKRIALLVGLVAWSLAVVRPLDAQNVLWVKGYGGSDQDTSNNVVLDDAFNLYVSGTFSGTVVFGAGEPNETVLTSTPGSPFDLFLAKYDRAGGLLWVRQASGTGLVVPGGMDLDRSGNILVAGAFDLEATFGPGEILETSFTAVGSLDAFLAKYDNDGHLIWARAAGGPGLNFAQGVGVDDAGRSCFAGFFDGSMQFAAGHLLDSAGSDDLYLARYDADGQVLWARAIGGPGRDQGYDVVADGAGNCYLSGEFFGTVVVGAGGPGETTLMTAEPGTDVLLAKYGPDGTPQWARSATSTGCLNGREVGRHIDVDDSGDVRVAGYFCGAPTTFGAGGANETELSSDGDWDVFTARYDASGELLWAKRAGGPGRDQGVDVSRDKLGNTYVTGRFDDGAVFGPGEANQTTLASEGIYDIFTVKYGPAGNLLWVSPAGGEEDDHGAGIGVDRLGDVRVTGNFASLSAVFGLGEPNETSLFTNGGYDGFLATFESTALEKIDLLSNEIQLLQASGGIASGAADRLLLTLRRARAALERGLSGLAILSLRSFSLQVRVYIASGTVAPQDGQWLLDAAQVIIAQILRTG